MQVSIQVTTVSSNGWPVADDSSFIPPFLHLTFHSHCDTRTLPATKVPKVLLTASTAFIQERSTPSRAAVLSVLPK